MQPGKKSFAKATRPKRTLSAATAPEPLESRCLLSGSDIGCAIPNVALQPAASPAAVHGYTPAQVRDAYGLNLVSGTGTGQTIAIVDAYNDPNIVSDLAAFDSEFGLAAAPSFKVVNQTGGSASSLTSDSGWAGEISLDVEWAHAIAPGANILLVEASDDSLANLMAGVNYARNAAGVSVVSMSWGGSEFRGQTGYDSYFTTPSNHTGVTFVAASGDEGSRFGVEWPASSPNVVAVGGTTLATIGSSATYSTESPWADSTGGYSQVEREPSFQRDAQTSGARTVPDVSYDANPSSGFAVYDSVSYEGYSGWSEYGGTSAGAPQWSALIAIADQARVATTLGTLDGVTQTLPALYQSYASSSTYAVNFHDVTAQSHSWFSRFITTTNVGYDLSTGLGTPKGPGIASTLEHVSGGSVATTTITTAPKTSPSFARPGPSDALAVADGPNVPTSITSATGGEGSAAPASTGSSSLAIATSPAAGQSVTARAATGAATVFNETIIHRNTVAAPGRQGSGIRLADISASHAAAALSSATAASWLGETDASLASWLVGGGGAVTGFVAAPSARSAASLAAATLDSAPAIAKAAGTFAAAIGAPAISLPAGILYRFASFDPVGTFSDAMADFARESAGISSVSATASPVHGSHRAWIVTGAVLGVDAILVARWYIDRIATRRRAKKNATTTIPVSPQAGPLPTGL